MRRLETIDLANMSTAADFWQTSMNEHEAWEALRLECKAAEEARKKGAEAP